MNPKSKIYKEIETALGKLTIRQPNAFDIVAYGNVPDIFQDKAVFESQENKDNLAKQLADDPKKFKEIFGFIQHIICAAVVKPFNVVDKKLSKCSEDEIPVNDLPLDVQITIFTESMNFNNGGETGLSPESFPKVEKNSSETPSST